MHPDDIPRFAELGATANMQPLWAAHEPQMDELTIPFLGERRAAWQYPFGALLAAGAAACAGSDWPVSQPRPAARRARGRQPEPARRRGGTGQDPFLPGQAIDLATALAAYTSGSARTNGLDRSPARSSPAWTPTSPSSTPTWPRSGPDEICQASVRQTWLRGHPA